MLLFIEVQDNSIGTQFPGRPTSIIIAGKEYEINILTLAEQLPLSNCVILSAIIFIYYFLHTNPKPSYHMAVINTTDSIHAFMRSTKSPPLPSAARQGYRGLHLCSIVMGHQSIPIKSCSSGGRVPIRTCIWILYIEGYFYVKM